MITVPKEPTAEMVRAGAAALKEIFPAISFEEQAETAWRAMVIASVSQPEKCSHCGKDGNREWCGVGGCPLGLDL